MRVHHFARIALAFALIVGPVAAQEVASTIVFTSTRDNPAMVPPIIGGEIYYIDYLVNGTFSAARGITLDDPSKPFTDIFPALSPDGRGKIVFDSNRVRAAGEPVNTSDLFLMDHTGTGRVFLTRGGSPTWAPPGSNGAPSKMIAFHASASGLGLPINRFPGSATEDSDIFIVNVDDLLERGAVPQNLTSNRVGTVDDDPNWSPDGRKIVFTSYVNDPSTTVTSAQIFMMNADGTGQEQLTNDSIEKRGPAWSPDGSKILFACRTGPPTVIATPAGPVTVATFEVCVMDAVANGVTTQLTFNPTENPPMNLTPTWSPDGSLIVFHRTPANQLWVMEADGTNQIQLTGTLESDRGFNLLATSWGVLKASPRRR